MKTSTFPVYDRAVIYCFRWQKENGGQLVASCQRYIEENRDIRLEGDMGLENSCQGVPAYGATFNVGSTGKCVTKMKSEPLLNIPGRITKELIQGGRALELLSSFRPVDMLG